MLKMTWDKPELMTIPTKETKGGSTTGNLDANYPINTPSSDGLFS